MNVNTYNQKGEKTGQMKLPEEIFGKDFKPDLIHQVIVGMQSNKRQGTAHTKDRGEVRGGGKKPWRQKGTGRARHGSNRSPIWIGGGVTFGPTKDKNYKKTLPKKIRKTALLSVLSAKVRDKDTLIVEDIKIEKPKTKIIKPILDKLSSVIQEERGDKEISKDKKLKPEAKKNQKEEVDKKKTKKQKTNQASILVISAKKDDTLLRATKNLAKVSLIEARNLNVLDVASFNNLIFLKESIKTIEKTFAKSKKEIVK